MINWHQILDAIAPLEARIRRLLSPHLWLSKVAWNRLEIPIRQRISMSLSERIQELLRLPFRPDKYWFAVGLAIMGLATIHTGVYLLTVADGWNFARWLLGGTVEAFFSISPAIQATWQVLVTLLSLSFVIAVFLFEFAGERDYEARIMPLFVEYTRLSFVIVFGLLSSLSFWVISLIAGNPGIGLRVIWSLTISNNLVFAINLVLLLWLWMRTLEILHPKAIRRIQMDQLRRVARVSTRREMLKRAMTISLNEESKDRGFQSEYFRVRDDAGRKLVSIAESMDASVSETLDVNLGLLELAANRVRKLASSEDAPRLKVLAYPGRRISRELAYIASVPASAYRPQVIEPIKQAFRYKRE